MDYGQYIPFGLTFAQGQQLREHQLQRVGIQESARQADEKLGMEKQKMGADVQARQQEMAIAEKDFGLRERSMGLQERQINATIANSEVMQRIALAGEKRNQEKYDIAEKPFMAESASLGLDLVKMQLKLGDSKMAVDEATVAKMGADVENGLARIGLGYAGIAQQASSDAERISLGRDELAQRERVDRRLARDADQVRHQEIEFSTVVVSPLDSPGKDAAYAASPSTVPVMVDMHRRDIPILKPRLVSSNQTL
jgi:hypothetical protein